VSARVIVAFAAVVVVATAALGTGLSLFIGPRLADVDWDALLLSGGDLAAVIELLLAIGMLGYAAMRLRRPATERPKAPKRVGATGVLGLGVLFALGAVLDPTFVGLVVIAGREDSTLNIAIAHLLWILVSQLPLVLLAGAVLMGAHERAVATFGRLRERIAPAVRVLLTAALMLAGAFFAADALSQLLRGRFLV